MTNEEIFKQAVGKAIERGWLRESIREYEIIKVYRRFFGIDETDILYMTVHFNKYPVSEEINEKGYCWHHRCTYSLSDLLFSHPFMRALCKGLSVCAGVRTILCHEKQSKACNKDLEHGNCDYKSKKEPAIFIVKILSTLPTDAARLEYVKNNILEVTE